MFMMITIQILDERFVECITEALMFLFQSLFEEITLQPVTFEGALTLYFAML